MVLDVIVKATLVLGVAAFFSVATRGRAPAAMRHAVWVAALLGAVLVPALSAALPALRVPLLPSELRPEAPTESSAAALPDEFEPLVPGPEEQGGRAPTNRVARAYPDPSPAVSAASDTRALLRAARDLVAGVPALALAWAVGVLILLARIVLARLSVVRVTRARVPGRAPWLPVARRLARVMRVPRRLRFLRSDRVSMPMACGVVRPAVVLPAEADAWDADRLRAVLLHELGHVRRRDCLTQAAADVALALLWFHPLAWVARRAIRRERERACDDLVLAAGTPAPDYASHLLDVARDAHHRTSLLTLAGGVAMARPSELEGRLMAILDEARPRRALTLRTGAAVAILSLAVVAPMSALDLWQAPGESSRALPDATATVDVDVEQEPTPTPTPTPTPSPGVVRSPAPMPTPAPVVAMTPAPAIAAMDGAWPMMATAPRLAGQPTPAVAPAAPVPPAPATAVPGGLKEGVKGGVPGGPAKKAKSHTPPDPRVVAALTAALGDGDAEVRRQALHTLARFRDPSTIDALATAVKHTDPEMRRQAAFALSHIRDPRAVTALQGALRDTDAQVRQQALLALARQRDPSVLEPLSAALKDASPDIRQQAAFALGQLRDARAVPALASIVGDPDRDVREQVVFALGQTRSPEAITPLLTALKDSDVEIRQQAAFALGQLRDPRALDALMVAAKDQHVDVRRQAFFAIGQVGDARAQDLAIAGLKDGDAEVRRMAAFALARIVDRDE